MRNHLEKCLSPLTYLDVQNPDRRVVQFFRKRGGVAQYFLNLIYSDSDLKNDENNGQKNIRVTNQLDS